MAEAAGEPLQAGLAAGDGAGGNVTIRIRVKGGGGSSSGSGGGGGNATVDGDEVPSSRRLRFFSTMPKRAGGKLPQFDSPWGVALAPGSFGKHGGDLLVGNFGDGAINAYNPRTGAFDGQLTNKDNNPIHIDGLWGLRFGNGVFGTPDTLLFSAGIGDEAHGLLGEIVAAGGGH